MINMLRLLFISLSYSREGEVKFFLSSPCFNVSKKNINLI